MSLSGVICDIGSTVTAVIPGPLYALVPTDTITVAPLQGYHSTEGACTVYPLYSVEVLATALL